MTAYFFTVQSMENVQLWTTTTQLWAAVARSDAEIALQRTKILKLESELQLMKGHRDGNIAQSDGTAVHQSGSKRGRRKKALPATLAATVSGPASDTNALSVPGRRVRAIPYKVDTPPRTDLEEKDKSTLTMPELVYRQPMDDRDQKSCTLTGNPIIRNETAQQKHSLRQTLEFQSPTNNSLAIAKDDLPFGHMNHLTSLYKPNNLIGGRKDSHFEQSLKESAAGSFLKTAGSLDHQDVITGDISYGAAISSGSLCPESSGNLMAKDAIVRPQFPSHFNGHNLEKSVPHELQKTWRYTGEDVSDEQDEGGASVQDDDDGDDVDDEDDENGLDDMHSEKVSNLWHSMPFR
ncbi:hypothetical protein L7F22_006462 [Adiantum nelumboides]|nr:hypothetical protein [Adiantum nelumboides]